MNEKYLIPVSILISSIVLASGIYLTTLVKNSNNNTNEKNIKKNILEIPRVNSENEHIEGSKKADIYIIEYSDLECMGCKAFEKVKKELIKKYSDNPRVGFVFRHFPLYKTPGGGKPLHPTSGIEARSTECLGKLLGKEKFFEMKDKIFKTTKSDGHYPVENLSNLAESLGVNKKEFEKCIASDEIKKKIEKSWQDAYDAGITSTPSIFVQVRGSKKIFKAKPGKEILDNAITSYLENN